MGLAREKASGAIRALVRSFSCECTRLARKACSDGQGALFCVVRAARAELAVVLAVMHGLVATRLAHVASIGGSPRRPPGFTGLAIAETRTADFVVVTTGVAPSARCLSMTAVMAFSTLCARCAGCLTQEIA